MSTKNQGTPEAVLGYRINDADNHFNEPLDLYERYIEPKDRDKAIRYVTDPQGNQVQLFGDRPSRFSASQVTYSKEELAKMLGMDPAEMAARGSEAGGPASFTTPGMLLNKLNPLRGLGEQERRELVEQFRSMRESYGNRRLRLALMDDQGIEAAVMYPASAHDIEFEFAEDLEAMYANIRAFNRWMHEEVGFAYENRMFLPPYIALADLELALAELERVLDWGAPMIQIKAGHAHGGRRNPKGGRSVADPVFDPFWARVNEAGVRVAAHLGATDYQKYGADWSEDHEATFGEFDAFQWVMYWGDRPAMELVAGLVLHNFFGRFGDLRVLISEHGTVWLPYLLRKMDHAFLMGRKAKWGSLEDRPSGIFRRHFLVAPFPEENVRRVIDEVGVEPIAFGSDFPHGEGLAFPRQYVGAQLAGLPDDQVRAIMRDNLADFLGLPR